MLRTGGEKGSLGNSGWMDGWMYDIRSMISKDLTEVGTEDRDWLLGKISLG